MMSGLANLPLPAMKLVVSFLDPESRSSLVLSSKGVKETVTHPSIWTPLWDQYVREREWELNPARLVSLLSLGRFSQVREVRIVSDKEVSAAIWRDLAQVVEDRGKNLVTGISVSAHLGGLSGLCLGRILGANHCVKMSGCEGLTEDHRRFILATAGMEVSKIRHIFLEGIEFGEETVGSYLLRAAVAKTFSFTTDRRCLSSDQQRELEGTEPGSGREEVVPPGGCYLSSCISQHEHEEDIRRRVAQDFQAIWDEVFF